MDKELHIKLAKSLKSFNIPSHRKTQMTPDNIRWLKKNLAVKNSENIKLNEVLELINKITF